MKRIQAPQSGMKLIFIEFYLKRQSCLLVYKITDTTGISLRINSRKSAKLSSRRKYMYVKPAKIVELATRSLSLAYLLNENFKSVLCPGYRIPKRKSFFRYEHRRKQARSFLTIYFYSFLDLVKGITFIYKIKNKKKRKNIDEKFEKK